MTTATTETRKVDYSSDPLLTDPAFRQRLMADICRTGLAIEQALRSAQVGPCKRVHRRRPRPGEGCLALPCRRVAVMPGNLAGPMAPACRPAHPPACLPPAAQDVEGVVDPDGKVTVVQTRPQM